MMDILTLRLADPVILVYTLCALYIKNIQCEPIHLCTIFSAFILVVLNTSHVNSL